MCSCSRGLLCSLVHLAQAPRTDVACILSSRLSNRGLVCIVLSGTSDMHACELHLFFSLAGHEMQHCLIKHEHKSPQVITL
jgi:hypothetical protein